MECSIPQQTRFAPPGGPEAEIVERCDTPFHSDAVECPSIGFSLVRDEKLDRILEGHCISLFGSAVTIGHIPAASNTVFLYNIPLSGSETELRKEYERFGPIIQVSVIQPTSRSATEMCGLIVYQDDESARSAIEDMQRVEFREVFMRCAFGNEIIVPAWQIKETIRIVRPADPLRQTHLASHAKDMVNFAPLEAASMTGNLIPSEYQYLHWLIGTLLFPDRADKLLQLVPGSPVFVPPPREALSHKVGEFPLQNRARFETLLSLLNTSRDSIQQCMLFCIEHSASSAEIVDIIFSKHSACSTARLYLVSDLLFNAACEHPAAWSFRAAIEPRLAEFVFLTKHIPVSPFARVKEAWTKSGMFAPEFIQGLDYMYSSEGDGSSDLISVPEDDPRKEMQSLGLWFRDDGLDCGRLQQYKRMHFGTDADLDGSSLDSDDYRDVDGQSLDEDDLLFLQEDGVNAEPHQT